MSIDIERNYQVSDIFETGAIVWQVRRKELNETRACLNSLKSPLKDLSFFHLEPEKGIFIHEALYIRSNIQGIDALLVEKVAGVTGVIWKVYPKSLSPEQITLIVTSLLNAYYRTAIEQGVAIH